MKRDGITKWAGRMFLVIAAPILALALAEGLLRLFSYGIEPEFVVEEASGETTIFRDNPDIGRLWFDPGLTRSPIPFSVGVKTNGLRIVILGESAAMGDPAPAFGLTEFLETILRGRYPDTPIEVINMAMTAIDSSVILEIARDLAPLQPDFVIVYMGNNEVVGPFGPASGDAGSLKLQTWFTRLTLRARSLRVGQLARSMMQAFTSDGEQSWRGLELFTERELSADSPVLTQLLRRYTDNARAIHDAIVDAGATPVFGTMATRLNWPPFKGGQVSESDEGVLLEEEGQWSEAYAHYQKLAAGEPESAEWRYRMARAAMALGRVEEGIALYTQSRDLDRLRFRADSTMNEVIDEVSRDGALFADVEKVLQQLWAQPERYFWDHVHLTPPGNYVAAMSFAQTIEPAVLSMGIVAKGNYLTFDQARRLLVYSEWDRFRLASIMHQRMLKPPLSAISFFEEFAGRLTREVAGVGKNMTREIVESERDLLAQRVEAYPDDYHLALRLGDVHAELGEHASALSVYEGMIARWPHVRALKLKYGAGLIRAGDVEQGLRHIEQGQLSRGVHGRVVARLETASILGEVEQFEEALRWIDRAIELDPGYAKSWYNRGVVYGRLNEQEKAESDFLKAVELEPAMGEAYNNLGVIALKREDFDAAESWFRKALEQQPLLISAMRNASLVTMQKGDWETAFVFSRQLSYLDPKLTDPPPSPVSQTDSGGRAEPPGAVSPPVLKE